MSERLLELNNNKHYLLFQSDRGDDEKRREAVCLRLEGVAEDVKAARDDGLFPIGFKRRVADAISGIELLQELLHRVDYVPEVEAALTMRAQGLAEALERYLSGPPLDAGDCGERDREVGA